MQKVNGLVIDGVPVQENPDTIDIEDEHLGDTEEEAHKAKKVARTDEELHAQMAKQDVSVAAIKAKRASEVKVLWTQSTRFTLIIGMVILFNAIILGVEADYGDKYRTFFMVIEHLLTAIFTLELIAHFLVEGPRIYFSDSMNWLDCGLVLMSVIDVWIIRNIGVKADLRIMSVLRMLRLVRLARLLKLVRMFKELTLLVTGFMESVKTLGWALLFLLSVVYVFAIFARQMIGDANTCTDEEVEEWECSADAKPLYVFNREIGSQASLFGGVDRAMLTLFVCLTEGCGIDIVHPTVLQSPILICFWGIFIFFTTYGLLNLIVGVFCEHALETAADNEAELLKSREEFRKASLGHMRSAFENMDDDHSGCINREEYLDAVMNDEEVIQAFQELKLDEEENLFDTLDAENEGHITFDQFFEGVMLVMKGHEVAKAKDMVATHLVCGAIARRAKKLEKDIGALHAQEVEFVKELRLIRELAPNASHEDVNLDLREKDDPMFAQKDTQQNSVASAPSTAVATTSNGLLEVAAPAKVEPQSRTTGRKAPEVLEVGTGASPSGPTRGSCFGSWNAVCSSDSALQCQTECSKQPGNTEQNDSNGPDPLREIFQKIVTSTEGLMERLVKVEGQLDLQQQQIQKLKGASN